MPRFSITLRSKDLALFKQIQSFFGVGLCSIFKEYNSVVYSVSSVKDLTDVIIPRLICEASKLSISIH